MVLFSALLSSNCTSDSAHETESDGFQTGSDTTSHDAADLFRAGDDGSETQPQPDGDETGADTAEEVNDIIDDDLNQPDAGEADRSGSDTEETGLDALDGPTDVDADLNEPDETGPDSSETDSSETDAASMCSTAGVRGTDVGQVAPNLEVFDCDGNSHRLDELCDVDAAWIFLYADWCPPCISFVRSQVDEVYSRYAEHSFEGFLIVTEDSGFSTATQDDCEHVRASRSIDSMPVYFDPTGQVASELNSRINGGHVVMSRGNVIAFKRHHNEDEVVAELRRLLGMN